MVVFKQRKKGSKKILPYKIEFKSIGSGFCGYRGFAFVKYDELFSFVYPRIKISLHARQTFEARNTLKHRQRYVNSLSRQINLYTIWPFKRVNEGDW